MNNSRSLKVIVISLKSATDRRSAIRERFPGASIFDAIGGQLEAAEVDLDGLHRNLGRAAKPGEIGCLLSHTSVWKKHCDNNWIIVLEDDAKPEPSFFDFINNLTNLSLPDSPTVLMLGHCQTKKENLWFQRVKQPLFKRKHIGGEIFGENYSFNLYGATAYAINSCAMKSLSSIKHPKWLADDWRMWREVGNLKIYHAKIPLIYEDLSFQSQTGNRKTIRHDLKERPAFEIIAAIAIQTLRIFRPGFFIN